MCVCVPEGVFVPVCVCVCTWVESPAHHAREDDEDEGQHLQVGGQDGGSFHMAQVFSRQGPLDNHLHTHTMHTHTKIFVCMFNPNSV